MAKAKKQWTATLDTRQEQRQQEWLKKNYPDIDADVAHQKLAEQMAYEKAKEMQRHIDAHIMHKSQLKAEGGAVMWDGTVLSKSLHTQTVGSQGVVSSGPRITKTNPTWMEDDISPHRRNIEAFKRIANRTIVDIGMIESTVSITFADMGILNVHPTSNCKLFEQGDLSMLNGQTLGDIVINPQYSIAGEMTSLLTFYTRYGTSVSFAIFGVHTPSFELEYIHAKP